MYVLIIFCDILNLEHNFTTCIIKCMSVVIEVLIGVWVLFVGRAVKRFVNLKQTQCYFWTWIVIKRNMKERKKNNPEVRCLTAGFFFHRIFLMSPDVAVSPRFRPRL